MQRLELEISKQPTDSTCGPTCLHAVYHYYGLSVELESVIDEVVALPGGGTLSVWLGNHALDLGFRATIQTANLQIFDPTWFNADVDIAHRLRLQGDAKTEPRLNEATRAHLRFIENGGEVAFGHLTPEAIYAAHSRGVPLVTGLSATYLYNEKRELDSQPDDVRGEPVGHFVVLAGSDPAAGRVLIADPLHDAPDRDAHYYWVDVERLIASILLGVLTYDASVLAIERRS